MKEPERILIVRLSHLGDVVCALGVYHALHEAYPQARLAWAIQPEFAGLVAGLPGVSEVIAFERRAGWRAWPAVRRALKRFDPDLTVDCQGNLKSAGVVWASGAPRRSGPARRDWREGAGSIVLNDPAPAAPGPHAIEGMFTLARHVAPQASFPPRTDPHLSPAEIAAGEAQLEARFPGAGAHSVVLAVSSTRDVRSWPADRWSSLAHDLAACGRHVLVLSGPAEADLGQDLVRKLARRRGVTHWVGQAGLRELAALFTVLARRRVPLVACDSGPMHLAAACGMTVHLLAGPQDAARTGPWPQGDKHRVLRAREAPPCAPCLARRCDHGEGPVCMGGILPEQVLASLDALE